MESRDKTGITVDYDLKLHPPILEEITKVPPERRVGPLIISERTGEPYKHRTFTQTWRKVANAAGIPSEVWNMDARARGISEGYDAGASQTDNMKQAGHTRGETSARYNWSSLPQTSRVAELRLARRDKNKG